MSGKYRDLAVFELGNDGRPSSNKWPARGPRRSVLGHEVLAV
jgi:hypothetical protein